MALAEFDAKKKNEEVPGSNAQPTLSISYFKIVAAASEDFDKYLRETRKFYEEELADEKDIRANFWPGTSERVRRSQRPIYDPADDSVEAILHMRPSEYERYGEPGRRQDPFVSPDLGPMARKPTLNEMPERDWRYERGYPNHPDAPNASYTRGGTSYKVQSAMDGYDRYDPRMPYDRQSPANRSFAPQPQQFYYESHDISFRRERAASPTAVYGADTRDGSTSLLFGPEKELSRLSQSPSAHSFQGGERIIPSHQEPGPSYRPIQDPDRR